MHAAVGSAARYRRLLARLEGAEFLDALVSAAVPWADRLMATRRVRGFVRGDTTGVPMHALLTDLPFGAWWMAIFLDLFNDEGSRQASRRLMALGVVAAAPTALSGWATWTLKDRSAQRVGVVHAAINAVATATFLASWTARDRGRHELGIGLARAATVPLLAAAFLGGHLSSGRRADEVADDTTP